MSNSRIPEESHRSLFSKVFKTLSNLTNTLTVGGQAYLQYALAEEAGTENVIYFLAAFTGLTTITNTLSDILKESKISVEDYMSDILQGLATAGTTFVAFSDMSDEDKAWIYLAAIVSNYVGITVGNVKNAHELYTLKSQATEANPFSIGQKVEMYGTMIDTALRLAGTLGTTVTSCAASTGLIASAGQALDESTKITSYVTAGIHGAHMLFRAVNSTWSTVLAKGKCECPKDEYYDEQAYRSMP